MAGRRVITDALRWQNFDDVMRAFFDLRRLLYMTDSEMYRIETRHMKKYGVIVLVIITEQFCREMVKIQAGTTPVKKSAWKRLFKSHDEAVPESDALLNFQNIRIITKTLAKYGIRGIFDGETGAQLRKIMNDLLSARHDAVHTVAYTGFDVLEGCRALEALFRRILDLSVLENSSNIDIARAGYELDCGNRNEAVKTMRAVIHMDDKTHNVLYNKGIAWCRLEIYGRAVKCLSELIVARPNDRNALIQLGLALGGMGRREEELKCYDLVLQSRPDDVIVLGNMCVTLADLGRGAEADSYLERMKAVKSDDPLISFYKGMTLGRLERHLDALEYFDKALGVRPGDPSTLFSKGVALIGMERYGEALVCIDAVLEAWHDNKKALLVKAGVLESLGRYEESKECHRLAESGLT